MRELLTIKEARDYATEYVGKNVTPSNISYLVQYGKVRKFETNGVTKIDKDELLSYYNSIAKHRAAEWKEKLGDDLNWSLSFDKYKEAETTKHVHRLHPYKGKFIPQLVEYFLDTHTDGFKREVFFTKEILCSTLSRVVGQLWYKPQSLVFMLLEWISRCLIHLLETVRSVIMICRISIFKHNVLPKL